MMGWGYVPSHSLPGHLQPQQSSGHFCGDFPEVTCRCYAVPLFSALPHTHRLSSLSWRLP